MTLRESLARVILNVVDITRFRQAEELKSTFVSVVSHELKTPVALIKGYAETLRREDADWDRETMQESLSVIAEEADHLTSLIDSLLEASRIQAGGLKLQPTDVHLPRLAEKVVAGFRTQTEIHSFELDFPAEFTACLGRSRAPAGGPVQPGQQRRKILAGGRHRLGWRPGGSDRDDHLRGRPGNWHSPRGTGPHL